MLPAKISVRRPRNFRVLSGAMLAISGLAAGMAFAVVAWHQRNIGDQPADRTVADVIERGIGDNALVRLSGVSISPTRWKAICRQASPTQSDRQATGLDESYFPLIGPFPAVSLYQSDPQRSEKLLMRITPGTIELVKQQLEHDRVLTGIVGRDDAVHTGLRIASWFSGMGISLPFQPADDAGDRPYVFQPIQWQPSVAIAAKELPRDTPVAAGSTLPPWMQDRIDSLMPAWNKVRRSQPLQGLIVSTLVAISGLVICGSGGPHWIICVLMPLPCLISLPGIGLRYGRGNAVTRLAYLLAGGAMLWWAYDTTWAGDRIFADDFDPLRGVLAYVVGVCGSAALVGVLVNVTAGRDRHSQAELSEQFRSMTLSPERGRDGDGRSSGYGLPPTAALRTEPAVRRYQDPTITITADSEMSEPMQLCSTAWQTAEFESPLVLRINTLDHVTRTTVQIGCHDIVLAITEQREEMFTFRLISVLEDGRIVATLATDQSTPAKPMTSSSGVVWEVATEDPIELLTKHLDRTITLSKLADAKVAHLESGDWRDVYLYSYRVIADIGHQHGVNPWKVYPSQHGRFHFPVMALQAV